MAEDEAKGAVATVIPMVWPGRQEDINRLLKQGYRVKLKTRSAIDPVSEVWMLAKDPD